MCEFWQYSILKKVKPHSLNLTKNPSNKIAEYAKHNTEQLLLSIPKYIWEKNKYQNKR